MSLDPLANPYWHALTGIHRSFAEHRPLAARYDPTVAAFAALPDEPSDQAWADLADLVGPGGVAVVFREPVTVPEPWKTLRTMPGVQMVFTGARPGGRADDGLVRLGASDVDDMLSLVERTKPGPFSARTIELGTYLGLRDEGRLVAMAGQRTRLEGHIEISAVCTDDSHRGRGLAGRLVVAQLQVIIDDDQTPILHAAADNTNAIRLYESLGFTTSRDVCVMIVAAPR